MTNLVYVTAAYSNAVFRVLMPEFESFIQKAGLSIPTPIPPAMIRRFGLPLYATQFGVNLQLTNRASLVFSAGFVSYYSGPREFNLDKQFGRWDAMRGTVRMTTNEVFAMATNTIFRLGYKLEDVTHGWPLKIDGPLGWDDGINFFPFYDVEWHEPDGLGRTTIGIDADRKEVAEITLDFRKIHRPDPKIDVAPETWAQHREELEQKMNAVRTNSPKLELPANLQFLRPPDNKAEPVKKP